MLRAPIQISWLAATCNLDGADIYLGLAAGMDDVVVYAMSGSQMVAFPFQHIRITVGDAEKMPLRVYAVRDASIVKVVTQPGQAPLEGFHRVRLDFHMSRAERAAEQASTAAAAKASKSLAEPAPPSYPVMAFLLTIGLPREREDEFYGRVVKEFLQRSWMTLPRLLKQIGCSTPSEIAAGTSSACPT